MARYARVIVEVEPPHLDRLFDYRIPDDADVSVGSRVEVVFSGRRVRGLVAECTDSSEVPESRLRDLRRVLGEHRWATPEDIAILRWAGRRFAAPLGDVVRHALPRRIVDVEQRAHEAGWYRPDLPQEPIRPGPEDGEPTDGWATYGADGHALLDAVAAGAGSFYWRPLPGEDLGARLSELVRATLRGGRDALVVVPEPVSAAADAVADVLPGATVDVRGDTSERALYRAWLRARMGDARVVVGERGVAFWPLARVGLTVVLDESSPALKERRSPRHHAREVALERARRARGVALLIGTVPSAEAWRLLAARRVRSVTPVRQTERAAAPVVEVDDRSDPRSLGRLGGPALDALRGALRSGEFGVVVAARRGEGRALACTECGLLLVCPTCGSSLALPSSDAPDARVLCEGCGWTPSHPGTFGCDRCGAQRFAPLAAGAERLGAELGRTFDGDTVAVLEGYAQPPPEPPAVIVATRGSVLTDAPGPVGAVVLPDLEGQLRRPTLDAGEDALRVAMRAAGWLSRARDRAAAAGESGSGRGSLTGHRRVVVQVRDPMHHAVQALVRWDPGGFWRAEVERRAELRFPPVAFAIRLDVGGHTGRVVADLRDRLPDSDDVLGPRRLDGRAGLLIKAADRTATLAALDPLRRTWSSDGLDVRVDVDPVDT